MSNFKKISKSVIGIFNKKQIPVYKKIHSSKIKKSTEINIGDSIEISKFFNTIDCLAHYRVDGECCPVNIQESMIHGKPVISHVSSVFNGQIEIISDCGFVVNDSYEYASKMMILMENKDFIAERYICDMDLMEENPEIFSYDLEKFFKKQIKNSVNKNLFY